MSPGTDGTVRRFDGRADVYAKFRPGYPDEVLRILEGEIAFNVDRSVADIASGTGILSKLFLKYGNVVFCVEPNEQMRGIAERSLSGFAPRFVSVEGRAEETTLGNGSVDLVAVGQALHWFAPEGARREFLRILRKDGNICILYNDRKKEGGANGAYEEIVRRFQRDLAEVPVVDDAYVARFFGNHAFKKFLLPNSQDLDLRGLLGRLESASYMPRPGSTEHAAMEKEVREIYAKHSRDGKIAFDYETRLYVGMIFPV